MARVTVEDCVVKVPNRFELVLLAAQRAREITSGAPLSLDRDDDKNPVVALREIADETVGLDHLKISVVRGMQKHVEIDEPEETHELDLDTALFGIDVPAGALTDAEIEPAGEAEDAEEEDAEESRRRTRGRGGHLPRRLPRRTTSTRPKSSPKTCWRSRKISISPIPRARRARRFRRGALTAGQCTRPDRTAPRMSPALLARYCRPSGRRRRNEAGKTPS